MSDKDNQNNNTSEHSSKSTFRSSRVRTRISVSASSVFRIVFLLLIVISIFRSLQGTSTLSFQSFMEMLVDCPQIPTTWITTFYSFDISFPSWLTWLKPIYSFLTSLGSVLCFFVVGILNVIPFLLYFLRWLIL